MFTDVVHCVQSINLIFIFTESFVTKRFVESIRFIHISHSETQCDLFDLICGTNEMSNFVIRESNETSILLIGGACLTCWSCLGIDGSRTTPNM